MVGTMCLAQRPTMTVPIEQLSATGLVKDFGGLRAVDVDAFALHAGEIRAVIGPNGAGKTTFVGLLCGRFPPTAGRIRFEGRDITGMPAHERVGLGIAYTFQITSIFGNLSLYDNVALPAQRRAMLDGGGDVRARAMAALKRVGLADRATEIASAQSYGHQRLLEVAMGLALGPKVLILDEPTQGLADSEIAAFIDLVREVARETTILLIEHNMPVVMALAERITVLDRGRILAEGTPEAIRADAAVQAAYLGG